jgi:lipopolysaccharide export system protein LptA
MNIVIGETGKIGPAAQQRLESEPVAVEARLLEIRDKRETAGSGNVVSGRIVTLLVPEGQKIPRGVESGEYRIYLRFVHRRQARF